MMQMEGKIMFGIKTRIKRIKEKKFINMIKNIPNNELAGINKDYRKVRIIISLTSYPKRFDELYLVIKSLMLQSMKPDEITLYLGSDSKKSMLPQSLLELEEYGLKIIFVNEDLKPHKKYFYSMQENENDIIITVDDDVVYDEDLVKDLYYGYENNLNCVIARRANRMIYDKYNNLLPYKKWIFEDNNDYKPSYRLLAVGVGGVLYPPHIFDRSLFNKELINKLALFADDIWLKYHELSNGIPVIVVKSKVCHPVTLDISKKTGLFNINVEKNNNDKVIKKIEEYYGNSFYDLIRRCEKNE